MPREPVRSWLKPANQMFMTLQKRQVYSHKETPSTLMYSPQLAEQFFASKMTPYQIPKGSSPRKTLPILLPRQITWNPRIRDHQGTYRPNPYKTRLAIKITTAALFPVAAFWGHRMGYYLEKMVSKSAFYYRLEQTEEENTVLHPWLQHMADIYTVGEEELAEPDTREKIIVDMEIAHERYPVVLRTKHRQDAKTATKRPEIITITLVNDVVKFNFEPRIPAAIDPVTQNVLQYQDEITQPIKEGHKLKTFTGEESSSVSSSSTEPTSPKIGETPSSEGLPTSAPERLPPAVPEGIPTALPERLPTAAVPKGLPTAIPEGLPTAVPERLPTAAVPEGPPSTVPEEKALKEPGHLSNPGRMLKAEEERPEQQKK